MTPFYHATSWHVFLAFWLTVFPPTLCFWLHSMAMRQADAGVLGWCVVGLLAVLVVGAAGMWVIDRWYERELDRLEDR